MITATLSAPDKWKEYGYCSPLIDIFKRFHPLNAEIEQLINLNTFPVSFKKNKFLLSPIDRNQYLFLITKGAVRGYVKLDKHEITTWISIEGEVIGSIDNLWDENKESKEYLQALEDVEAIALPHKLTMYLHENFAEANIIGRKMVEMYYKSAEERAYICRIPSAEKRYKHFLKAFPGLAHRISLKHIASFLAMRIETLSRVRAKM